MIVNEIIEAMNENASLRCDYDTTRCIYTMSVKTKSYFKNSETIGISPRQAAVQYMQSSERPFQEFSKEDSQAIKEVIILNKKKMFGVNADSIIKIITR